MRGSIVASSSRRRSSGADPRGALWDRRDLLYGTQIGAWDEDGGTALNNTTARANVISAAPKLIRWQMWRTPCDIRGTACQTTASFDAAFNGIRNTFGAVPLIGLPPLWTDQYPGGPEPWSYAWQQWVVQRVDTLLDGGGSQDVLFEMGNEPNNYNGLTAQQYFDQQWVNVPLLKKWARANLSREIYVGGFAWANSYEPDDLTAAQAFLTACKNAYTANGNDRDWIPDFISTHCYLTGSENTGQAVAQSRINDWGSFYRGLGTWIKTNFAGLTDQGYPIADQIKVVDSEFNDTIVNENTLNDSQTWTDFYAEAMMNMHKAAKVWASVQFTIASHSGTALDLLNSDGTAKPLYNSFKTQWAKPVTSGLAFNTAEGGTNGTAITVANSAGASGVPFTGVNIGSGAAFAYSTTRAYSGTKSFQISTGATATFVYAAHSFPALDQVWARGFFYFTANPPAITLFRFIGGSGTLLRGAVGIDATGHLRIINSAGSVISTMTATISLNQWIRVEARCIGSATAGQVEIKLFTTPGSATPTETLTSAATINTGGPLTDIWWGESGAVANIGPYWMDNILVDQAAYPGPASSGLPTVSSGTLLGYWNAGAITGLTDGAAVGATWDDSSGNGRNLTVSGNPTYQTDELNGQPAVRLDGAGDYLTNTAFSQAQPLTLYLVARSASVSGTTEVLLASGASVDVALYIEGDKDLGFWAGNGPLAGGNIGSSAHVIEVLLNGASSALTLDTTITSGNAGNESLIGLSIGTNRTNSGEYFTGDLFEILAYSGALSSGDRSAIRSYLGTKYGITV